MDCNYLVFPFHFQLCKIIIATAKCAVKISFVYNQNFQRGRRGGGWGGGSSERCLKWGGGGSLRDLSKKHLKTGSG